MIPCWRIDSTNSESASAPKSLRGCNGLGVMLSRLTRWIFSESSTAAIPGAGAGCAAMSALRPLPSAIFAIAQRLSEATPQRKQLVATSCGTYSIVHGHNPHRDLHSRAFTRSGRRFHVLRHGDEQNRSARLSFRAPAGRYSDVERTGNARRVAYFCGLDPCLRLLRGQIFAAAMRREHGRRLWPVND